MVSVIFKNAERRVPTSFFSVLSLRDAFFLYFSSFTYQPPLVPLADLRIASDLAPHVDMSANSKDLQALFISGKAQTICRALISGRQRGPAGSGATLAQHSDSQQLARYERERQKAKQKEREKKTTLCEFFFPFILAVGI